MIYKKQKFKNKKTTIDNIVFDSKREGQRWLFLKEKEKAGEISNLQRQVKFELIPPIYEEQTIQLKTKEKVINKLLQKGIYYICDFQYEKDGEVITEDIKIAPHLIPKEYLLKEKLMFWKYRIRIKRVYKPNENI